MDFNNHYNYDHSNMDHHEQNNGISQLEDCQVPSVAEMIQRMLSGNIVDQTVQTSYWNGNHDDPDLESFLGMDLIDRNEVNNISVGKIVDMTNKINELEAQRLAAIEAEKQRLIDLEKNPE